MVDQLINLHALDPGTVDPLALGTLALYTSALDTRMHQPYVLLPWTPGPPAADHPTFRVFFHLPIFFNSRRLR